MKSIILCSSKVINDIFFWIIVFARAKGLKSFSLVEFPFVPEKFDEVYRRIAKLQSNLRRIAFQHKMSILIVNNAVNNGTRPALGKLFSKVANTRLFINKNNEITFEKFSPFDKLKQSVKIRMIINENGVTNIDQ